MPTRTPSAYLVNLKPAGIKDRELASLIAELDRMNRDYLAAFTALEKARREHAASDAELETLVSDAITAGEEIPVLSVLRAERDAALYDAERTANGARDARDKAARKIETYIANHEADLRAQVRGVLDKRRAAREEARTAYLDALAAETTALGTLLWCQEIPYTGRHDDPSSARARLLKAYDDHPAVSRVRQAVREVDEALEPPTDRQFEVARETSKRGYLHDPSLTPKDNRPTLTHADLAGAMR